MFKYLKNWYFDWTLDGDLNAKIFNRNLKGAAFRCQTLSIFFAFAFAVYGITSHKLLSEFSTVSLWDNIWPRLVFNSLPFLAASLLIAKSSVSDKTKLLFWFTLFSIMLHCAAWINFFPLIMDSNQELIGIAHAANVYSATLAFVIVSPPNRYLLYLNAVLWIVFWVPFLIIVKTYGSLAIHETLLGDILHTTILNSFLSSMIYGVRVKLTKANIRQESQATLFLGKNVSDAIYQGKTENLEDRSANGFLLAIDIRGYTQMVLQHDPRKISELMDNFHKIVAESASEFGAHIHKSIGDGYIISFGLLDSIDLSEIADIENEVGVAEDALSRRLCSNSVLTIEKIISRAQALFQQSQLNTDVCIGAAIDYGQVELKMIGDKLTRSEFDIFGPTVIRCARLEAHSKVLKQYYPKDHSVWVLSEEAERFRPHSLLLDQYDTNVHKLRDFPDVKKVYAFSYDARRSLQLNISKVLNAA